MAGKRLQVNWSDGLKLRTKPEPTDATYTGIKVPHGTVVDAIGEPHQYDDLFTFQQVRTPDGRTGWLTLSYGSTVYLVKVKEEEQAAVPVPEGPTLRVDWLGGLRMRAQPEPSMASFTGTVVPFGAQVTSLGPPQKHPEGYTFQKVRLDDGRVGWLTLSYGSTVYLVEVKEEEGAAVPPPEPVPEGGTLWVDWLDGLRMREQPEPSVDSFIGTVVPFGAQVTSLGSPQRHPEGYTFQKVRLDDGQVGWLTLSYGSTVYLSKEKPELVGEPIQTLQANAPDGWWVKLHQSPEGAIKWWVGGAVPLNTLYPASAGAKIGQSGQWIQVETPAFKRGYIAAQYLKPFTPSKHKPSVRPGESPYIYGVHDRYDRNMLQSAGVTGWVLFTHGIGTDYRGAGGDLKTYYEWANDGFGILARLNHGYGSSGTIPKPQQYDDFARTCAKFVERSIDHSNPHGGCHIWVIGNEMNNPREYPGNHDGEGGDPITPENYADCFNRVYKAIKQVYRKIPGLGPADGAVVMGAVDPYNAIAGCNGDWFTRALRKINVLDGFALHAYTHGTDPKLITDRKLFGEEHNPPQRFPDKNLSWQYYNFYAYRTFMDLIPARWRDVPVFITETDQVQTEWANTDSGWVKSMYAEVDRWNSNPNHQRIYCALLFRWEAHDGWQIKDKRGVLEDLKAAARKKYKWSA